MKSKAFTIAVCLLITIVLANVLIGWRLGPRPTDKEKILNTVKKCLPLLEQSSYNFTVRSELKCASCHHNALTAMVAEKAREKGIPVNDSLAIHRIRSLSYSLKEYADVNKVSKFIIAKFLGPYILMGLYAEKYAPDFSTDIAVDFLLYQASSKGSFNAEYSRPPLETGDIHLAAVTVRSLQLYAAPSKKILLNQIEDKTRLWLEQAHSETQQDLCFQLLGLHWMGSSSDHLQKVKNELVSLQHADGGWGQLSSMKSDAYATGQALYALFESGLMKTEDDCYQKGIEYLLRTQEASGVWIVQTRSNPIQKFFNCDFPPYDENQFISAAASGWACLSLMNALPDEVPVSKR